MTAPRHVVLGGNGVIGRETLRALRLHGLDPVSVGRRPAVDHTDASLTADLLDADAVGRALDGADVAYFVAGLPYSASVWAEQWPTMVQHTIAAARRHGTHLVYLDNVYAYGRVSGPMTEDTPIRPLSRKGRVRAEALDQLASAAADGLRVTIGRSADFFGPGATTSVLNGFVLDRIAAGKRPTWLLDAGQPHSLTSTVDVGDALVVLGTDERAAGRTWHLPTAPARTGRQVVELAGLPATQTAVMGSAMLRLGGVFSASARETLEMRYQWAEPSVLDSGAFERTFGIVPTPLEVSIPAALAHTRSVSR